MSKQILHRCDICGDPIKITEGVSIHPSERFKKECGVVIEMGYSEGGWGHRRDFFPKFAEEICVDCFDHIQSYAIEIGEFIKTGQKSTMKAREALKEGE